MTPDIDKNDWERHTRAATGWLRRSIEATGGKGSAHSWRPLTGWSKAYPETTGYIIPTLLDYAVLHRDDSLKKLAVDCADWLMSIQLPNGAFAGLLAGNDKPSVFNTSQILFGLARIAAENGPDSAAGKALERAVQWLVSLLETDGSWKKHAFVADYTPGYYTRAVWGVLCANKILQNDATEDRMRRALRFYAAKFQENHSVSDWGFRKNEAAFTHTIAYTLEGFLECALHFNDTSVLAKTKAAADHLLHIRAQSGGRIAGRYDQHWQGDYSFICLTGHAQLSILYRRLYQHFGETKYQYAGREILQELIACQKMTGNKNRIGALPGSKPFYGPYLPFRYPNWGVKFFLDAMNED